MTEKIDWYREVLELEPHSRLFFPLARMLAEEGRVPEALACLKDGLARHPEFMEARLLYVELLHRSGEHEECARQVALVERPLSGYAGFWEAWGAERAASAGDEAGWALAFLAAVFGRKPVSLQAVMERGLASILGGDAASAAVAAPAMPAADGAMDVPVASFPVGEASAADAALRAMPAAAPENFIAPHTVSPQNFPAVPLPDDAAQTAAAPVADVPPLSASVPVASRVQEQAGTTEASSMAVPSAEDAPASADAAMAEAVSRQHALLEEATLRTRSMADVLAEQGDVRGALDIYLELKKNAASPDVFMELQRRIDALTARLEEDEQPVRTGQPAAPAATGKDKLISMLEALAERVEARAQS